MKHFVGHFDRLLTLVGLSVINSAALSVTGGKGSAKPEQR